MKSTLKHPCFLFLLFATLIYMLAGYTHPYEMESLTSRRETSSNLKINGSSFALNNKPFQILCGAIHYFRVTTDSYEDRILKLKGMGLNSVDIYIPWNLHEPTPGHFSTKYADQLIKFIEVAKKHNIYVIIRPGPYICSEWDLGGLPSWLLQDSEMKLRSTYPGFKKAVVRYFDHLLPLLKNYQFRYGGPIIAIQIENEYGSFDNDVEYMGFIREQYEKHGLEELYFVCDNLDGLGKYKMSDDVLQTINFMTNAEKNVEALLELQPDKPVFVTEFWDGWFTHWGEKHHVVDVEKLTNTLEYLLKRGASVNFYMLHGGTNFGFMNGANADDDGSNYQCDVTSYDYDAPISEGGALYVEKYEAFKRLLQKYSKVPLNQVDSSLILSEMPTESYGDIEMTHQISLNELLSSDHMVAIEEEHVCNMEALPWKQGIGQQYGYIVYETKIQHQASILTILNARDYVIVIVNGQAISTTMTIEKSIRVKLEGYIKTGSDNTIQILVENAGRVNYGLDLNKQRKGILGKVQLDGKEMKGWNIFPLQFEENWIQKLSMDSELWQNTQTKHLGPTLYKGTLKIVEKGIQDTHIKLPGWFKGVLFLNGNNVGRYWSIGPQKSLYVPKQWLRTDSSDNIFILFDLHGNMSKCKHLKYPCIVSSDERDVGQAQALTFSI